MRLRMRATRAGIPCSDWVHRISSAASDKSKFPLTMVASQATPPIIKAALYPNWNIALLYIDFKYSINKLPILDLHCTRMIVFY